MLVGQSAVVIFHTLYLKERGLPGTKQSQCDAPPLFYWLGCLEGSFTKLSERLSCLQKQPRWSKSIFSGVFIELGLRVCFASLHFPFFFFFVL